MNTPEAASNFQNDEKKVDISVSLDIKATEISHEHSESSRGGNKWFFLGNLILKIIFYIVSLSSPTTVLVVVVRNNNNYYSGIELVIIFVSLGILMVMFLSILCLIKNSENRNEQQIKTMTDYQVSQPTEDSSGNEEKSCCVSKFKKWICRKVEKRNKKRKSIFRRRRK